MIAAGAPTCLRVTLGSDPASCLVTGAPVLAGSADEKLFGAAQPTGQSGPLRLYASPDWLIGGASVPVFGDIEAATRELYAQILQAARGRNLARIWNYVPGINALGPAGVERYRLFCRGRSLAFEAEHGAGFPAFLPAASAVGCTTDTLTAIFAATCQPTTHFENPNQVPAYHYPREYGPRSPSFARATRVGGAGKEALFISGTAAIRGHASFAPGKTAEQLECTLENLRAISIAAGFGPNVGADRAGPRHFKVYLRFAEDLPLVSTVLQQRLFRSGDDISYLQADVCRASLNIEIEATLLG